MGYVCSDCNLMDLYDRDKYDRAFCSYYKKYYPVGDNACSHISKRENSSACYLTTALCNILGYTDDCCIMNSLRSFRENYMRNNEEGILLLREYDTYGPIIANDLLFDPHKEYFAYEMLNSTIIPCITLIKNGENEEAIESYKKMYYSLIEDLKTNNYLDKKAIIKKRKHISD